MTANQIILALMRDRYRRTFVLPRFTPLGWWECDVFEQTKAGYWREYEVKTSRADFFGDASKARTLRVRQGDEWVRPTVTKHELLAGHSPIGPSQFWFVVPAGLVQLDEVPEWAGLIECVERPRGPHKWRVRLSETRSAPRLHRKPLDEAVVKVAREACYWRMHRAMCRNGAVETSEANA